MIVIYINNIFSKFYYSFLATISLFFLLDNYIEIIFYIFIKIFLTFNDFLLINNFCKNQLKITDLSNIVNFLLINFIILYFILIFFIYIYIYFLVILKKIQVIVFCKLIILLFLLIFNYSVLINEIGFLFFFNIFDIIIIKYITILDELILNNYFLIFNIYIKYIIIVCLLNYIIFLYIKKINNYNIEILRFTFNYIIIILLLLVIYFLTFSFIFIFFNLLILIKESLLLKKNYY
jgi:hypothetical protein